jgi:hypothetical protein
MYEYQTNFGKLFIVQGDSCLAPGEKGQQCNSSALWFRFNDEKWRRVELEKTLQKIDNLMKISKFESKQQIEKLFLNL